MAWWGWVLIIAAIVIIALGIVSYRLFKLASARHDPDDGTFIASFYPEAEREGYIKAIRRGQEFLDAQKREDVSIQSDDGLKLAGDLYRAEKPTKRVLIFFHGYHGSPFNDFAPFSQFFMEKGMNILLPNERAHMRSEGVYITFGIKERYDVLRWAEYAVREFGPDCEVMLMGLSMGAASVLDASGLELPAQVHGIVSDCGFSSAVGQLEGSVSAMHMPKFLVGLANFWYKVLAHCSLADSSAIESVKSAKVPILMIHGGADIFVHTQMGRDIAAAAPTCTDLVIVPGAGHAGSILVQPELEESKIEGFMESVMGWDLASDAS